MMFNVKFLKCIVSQLFLDQNKMIFVYKFHICMPPDLFKEPPSLFVQMLRSDFGMLDAALIHFATESLGANTNIN